MKSEIYIVTVKFIGITAGKKEYDFVGYEHYNLGDIVVVDTKYGLVTAEVTGFQKAMIDYNTASTICDGYGPLREVICKVDTAAFLERKQKLEEKQKIKQQMDCIINRIKEDDIYAICAEKSPELKELLDKYKKL